MNRITRPSSFLIQLFCLLGLLAIDGTVLASGTDERYSTAGKAKKKRKTREER